MNIVNRIYINTAAEPLQNGVFALPLEEPWFVHVLHVTFRNYHPPRRLPLKPHVHDVYHVVLVSEGSGTFIVDNKPRFCERGDVVLTSPKEWHSFAYDGERLEYCEVTFEFRNRRGEVLTLPFHEVLTAWSGRDCPMMQVATTNPELHRTIMSEIEAMARAGFHQERDYLLKLSAGLSRIFLALYTHLHSNPKPAQTDPMQRVHEYVHRHFSEQFTLEQLAEIGGVTPNYLSRRFKTLYGATPITYQHRLRAQAAADLLKTTEHPIKRIAEMVGFRDVYFFSRMFRKVRGVPPAKYRRTAS
jgi:AraC-like DNA-binding protein/mannose-6-phosphate isomerase-like protein (cupin superfamily)